MNEAINEASGGAAYRALGPDQVLDALEALGWRCDGRLMALNSYENRVYQVGIEDESPVIAKFYRPGRWTDEAILEEHVFSRALADGDIPVVPPLEDEAGMTLHHAGAYRAAVYPRRGGRAPELEDLSQAGIAEFARQFLFVKRREAYKHDGDHKIWMTWGGSAGHQGLRICQAKTGTFEKGAEWSTDLYTVGQWKERQDRDRVEKERTESRNVKAELKKYIGDNGGTNKTAVVEYVATLQNVPKTRTKLYLDELIGEGDVEVTQTSKTRTALSLVECEQLDPCGC